MKWCPHRGSSAEEVCSAGKRGKGQKITESITSEQKWTSKIVQRSGGHLHNLFHSLVNPEGHHFIALPGIPAEGDSTTFCFALPCKGNAEA